MSNLSFHLTYNQQRSPRLFRKRHSQVTAASARTIAKKVTVTQKNIVASFVDISGVKFRDQVPIMCNSLEGCEWCSGWNIE